MVRANKERLALFEDKLYEGITALSLLVEIPARNGSTTQWLNEVWRLLNTQESTRPLAIYLAASLNVVDRMYLFDAVLSRLNEPDMAASE